MEHDTYHWRQSITCIVKVAGNLSDVTRYNTLHHENCQGDTTVLALQVQSCDVMTPAIAALKSNWVYFMQRDAIQYPTRFETIWTRKCTLQPATWFPSCWGQSNPGTTPNPIQVAFADDAADSVFWGCHLVQSMMLRVSVAFFSYGASLSPKTWPPLILQSSSFANKRLAPSGQLRLPKQHLAATEARCLVDQIRAASSQDQICVQM